MIGAGKRDLRVTIQRPVRVADAAGARVTTWTDVTSMWASRQDVGGREFARTGQVAAEADAIFRMLWPTVAVTTEMRILDTSTGRVYEIIRLAEVERRAEVEILAKTMPEQAIAIGG